MDSQVAMLFAAVSASSSVYDRTTVAASLRAPPSLLIVTVRSSIRPEFVAAVQRAVLTAASHRVESLGFLPPCRNGESFWPSRGLRTVERGDLVVPRTATELDKRSFSVAAPVIWNSLPDHLCSSSISKGQFWCGMKTHFFPAGLDLRRTLC